jgi:hypothetical protein
MVPQLFAVLVVAKKTGLPSAPSWLFNNPVDAVLQA